MELFKLVLLWCPKLLFRPQQIAFLSIVSEWMSLKHKTSSLITFDVHVACFLSGLCHSTVRVVRGTTEVSVGNLVMWVQRHTWQLHLHSFPLHTHFKVCLIQMHLPELGLQQLYLHHSISTHTHSCHLKAHLEPSENWIPNASPPENWLHNHCSLGSSIATFMFLIPAFLKKKKLHQ